MKSGYQRSTAAYKTSFVFSHFALRPLFLSHHRQPLTGKNIETPVAQSFFSPRTEEKHFCINHLKQKQFTTYSDLFMKHKIYLLCINALGAQRQQNTDEVTTNWKNLNNRVRAWTRRTSFSRFNNLVLHGRGCQGNSLQIKGHSVWRVFDIGM